MPDNTTRAYRAFRAVRTYISGEPLSMSEGIADLLCDLHHLADERGYDWERMTISAECNYTAEALGDDD